jgi:predicted nucleic acid-binding protein
MIFLLDTTIFSEFMRRSLRARERLESLQTSDRVLISTITLGEIQYGIHSLPAGKRRQALERETIHLLSMIPCLGVPPEATGIYAELKVKAVGKSAGLSENDLWIASHAAVLNAVLVTADKDFSLLPELSVQNWKQ